MDLKGRKDIEELSFHEPVIHHVMSLVYSGHMTFEQGMIYAVFYLIDKNKKLEETLVKAINSKPYLVIE